MGRTPKPKPAHEKNGTYRPSRHGTGNLPVCVPDMPPDLSPIAQSLWNILAQKLEAAGLVADVDGLALRLLCESFSIYVDAGDAVREQGLTVEHTNKAGATNRVVNPNVRIRSDAWKQIVILCKQFGLTPSARTGLHLAPAEEEDDATDIIGFKVTG